MYRKELMALGHHFYAFSHRYECAATLKQLAGEIERGQLKANKDFIVVFRKMADIIDVMTEDSIRSMLIDHALNNRQASKDSPSSTVAPSEQPADATHSGSVSGESTDSGGIQSQEVPSVSEEVRKE